MIVYVENPKESREKSRRIHKWVWQCQRMQKLYWETIFILCNRNAQLYNKIKKQYQWI